MVQIKQAKVDSQPRPNSVAEPPKKNRFYALKGREEKEKSTDVDNGNLLVFYFPVYALLDPGSTLSIVTPFVANQFNLLTEILHEPL